MVEQALARNGGFSLRFSTRAEAGTKVPVAG
jgi:hypothetical protein